MAPQVRFRTRIPAYRHRPGRSQALVTLTDSATRQRRDYWLGEYDSPQSRELYHRIIAEWEANGRRFPTISATLPGPLEPDVITVNEVVHEYWQWAQGYYSPSHLGIVKTILCLLRRYNGSTPAAQFGPRYLRLLRDEMIRGDPKATPPRKPWARSCINLQMQRTRHIFKWAAARELVPVSVYQSLCTLEPLRRGRSLAHETKKVGPVPQHLLDATLPLLNRPVRAVAELQLLTGARAGELLRLRAIDLQRDEPSGVWTFRPVEHKTAHHGKERIIYFGPRAQEILRPFFVGRSVSAFLFSPADAEADRRAKLHAARTTPLSYGNSPGTHRRETPMRKPHDCYNVKSYGRSIDYACDKAFPPPEHLRALPGETFDQWRARLSRKEKAELTVWRKEHRWHPHQLRHNAATNLRREFGLEAAQIALGHASAQITDAVYAERDCAKVIEIMRKIG